MRGSSIVRGALLVLLFSVAGAWEIHQLSSLRSIANADFWWHLQTGLTIVKTHALPHSGWGSQLSASPWIDTSWLYDAKIALLFRAFDLKIVVLATIAFRVLLAAVVFVLAGGLRGRFFLAALLSAIAQFLLAPQGPVPLYCSLLGFAIVFALLLGYRRSNNARLLYWLPIVFLLWANSDVHFVYGIALLVLFAASSASDARDSLPTILGASGAALLASIATPYGWKPYGLFFAQWFSAAIQYFPEQSALRFRSAPDYALMLLIMSAFLVLGLRRSRDVFQIGALVLCTCAAFYARGDAWLAVIAAVAILGAAPSPAQEKNSQDIRWQVIGAAALALIVLTAVAMVRLPRDRSTLLAQLRDTYPVAAADFIRSHQLPQPIFNSAEWGGFLSWYLPEYPVAIDGRTELYGDDYEIHYAKVMNADEHYSTFAPLNDAQTIVLPKKSLMGAALATVPAFKTVYSDDVAIVLEREQP